MSKENLYLQCSFTYFKINLAMIHYIRGSLPWRNNLSHCSQILMNHIISYDYTSYL